MNLDDLKKLSEVFGNIAQPVATVIAAVLVYKASTAKKPKKKRRK
ncbi:hypothetical protein [Holdemania massiliensis]|nr:hypothetical protein [Holdemania massiliensis]